MPRLSIEKSFEWAVIILRYLYDNDINTITLLKKLGLTTNQLICESISNHLLNTCTNANNSTQALDYYLRYISQFQNHARFIIDSLRNTTSIFNLDHLKSVLRVPNEDDLLLAIVRHLFKKRVPFATADEAKIDYLKNLASLIKIDMQINKILNSQIINAFTEDPEFYDYLLYFNFILNKNSTDQRVLEKFGLSFEESCRVNDGLSSIARLTGRNPLYNYDDFINFLTQISQKYFSTKGFFVFMKFDVLTLKNLFKDYLREQAKKQIPTFPHIPLPGNTSPGGRLSSQWLKTQMDRGVIIKPLLETRQVASRTESIQFTSAKERPRPPRSPRPI